MNVQYFSPEMPEDNKSKKADKGLLSREALRENAQKKAQKIEQSKSTNGLMSKNEGKLLTNDGREILSEKK
jgi:hypothetical protein